MNLSADPNAIAERGRALYVEKLRTVLEPKETGSYVVLNVETGEFELAYSDFTYLNHKRRFGLNLRDFVTEKAY